MSDNNVRWRRRFHRSFTEGAYFHFVAVDHELHPHHGRAVGVVAVDDEPRLLQVGTGGKRKPTDDLHPAILAIMRDVLLAAEVVIEVDFVPWFLKLGEAVGDRLDPDRLRILRQKNLGAMRIVVQKKDSQFRMRNMSRLGLALRLGRISHVRSIPPTEP